MEDAPEAASTSNSMDDMRVNRHLHGVSHVMWGPPILDNPTSERVRFVVELYQLTKDLYYVSAVNAKDLLPPGERLQDMGERLRDIMSSYDNDADTPARSVGVCMENALQVANEYFLKAEHFRSTTALLMQAVEQELSPVPANLVDVCKVRISAMRELLHAQQTCWEAETQYISSTTGHKLVIAKNQNTVVACHHKMVKSVLQFTRRWPGVTALVSSILPTGVQAISEASSFVPDLVSPMYELVPAGPEHHVIDCFLCNGNQGSEPTTLSCQLCREELHLDCLVDWMVRGDEHSQHKNEEQICPSCSVVIGENMVIAILEAKTARLAKEVREFETELQVMVLDSEFEHMRICN